jgi:predicted CoA-substrate-specific enzyme activase
MKTGERLMCPVKSGNDSDSDSIYTGLDIGSTYSKAVVFSGGSIRGWAIIPSGGNYKSAADEVLNKALSEAEISPDDITYCIATGYGADSAERVDDRANDITCQGRGINYLFPSVRTVADIGGQLSKVFRIDGDGRVENFIFSEKCAAGSGRLLQVIAKVLQVDINVLGELSLKSKNKVDFTTGCAVFIESEVISRIAEGFLKEDIIAGINRSLSSKIHVLIERLGLEPEYALVGGGAKNIGLVKSIEEKLQTKVLIPEEPQLVAALGAALIAEEKVIKIHAR